MSEGLLVWGKPAGTGENVVSPHGSDVSWAPQSWVTSGGRWMIVPLNVEENVVPDH